MKIVIFMAVALLLSFSFVNPPADSIADSHAGKINCIAYSPDGKTVATAQNNNSIILWNATNGQQINILQGHTAAVTGVAYSPDGKYLASSSKDKTVRIWDLGTGKAINSIHGFVFGTASVCFSPDSNLLAIGCEMEGLRLWNVERHDWEKESNISEKFIEDAAHTSFSADSRWVVTTGNMGNTSGNDYAVRVWNAKTAAMEHKIKVKSKINDAVLDPRGNTLAICSGGKIKLYTLETRKLVKNMSMPKGKALSVAWSGDGKWLATAGNSNEVIVWNTGTYKPAFRYPVPVSALNSIRFSSDSKNLAAGGDDGKLYMWNLSL